VAKIATADCETDPFLHGRIPEAFLWGYYDGETYREFKSAAEFVAFISTQNVIIYFHNGGKFDFHMLIEMIPYQQLRIVHNRILSIKIGKAELRDSYAILPVKLADYRKDDIEYWKLEKSVRHKYMKEISAYQRGDCVYLYELVDAYIGLAGRRLTLASNALGFAKALGIDPGRTNKLFDQQFRGDYFYGGRCEALRKGSFKDVNMYDIRSAYPFAMCHDHPTGDAFRLSDKLLDPERSRLCFYKVDATSRGAFPRRARGGGIYFPHERGTFTVTGHELHAAIDTGSCDLHRVIECREFYDSINFSDYVLFWFDERMKHEKAKPENIVAKLMMNSLYGKTAQNPENYCDYFMVEKGSPVPEGWHLAAELPSYDLLFRRHAEHMKEKMKEKYDAFPQYINVATGSSITGQVRAMLLRAIASQGGEALYCDTDSLFTRGELATGDNLGQWQFEGKAKTIHIAGKKLYAAQMYEKDKKGKYKQKVACKGVKLTFDEIKHITKGGEVVWKNEAPNFSLVKPPQFTVRKVKRR